MCLNESLDTSAINLWARCPLPAGPPRASGNRRLYLCPNAEKCYRDDVSRIVALPREVELMPAPDEV